MTEGRKVKESKGRKEGRKVTKGRKAKILKEGEGKEGRWRTGRKGRKEGK